MQEMGGAKRQNGAWLKMPFKVRKYIWERKKPLVGLRKIEEKFELGKEWEELKNRLF